MSARRRYLAPVLAVVIAASVALAACGSDDGDDASSDTSTATPAAASSVAVEPRLVGVINVQGTSEITRRQEAGAKAAAQALGWDYKSCDAQGDPQRQSNCATSLLNQDVDILLGLNVEASVIPNQLEQAKDEGIPFVNLGGPVRPNDQIATQVVEDEAAMTRLLDQYMLDRLGSEPAKIANTEFPPIYAFALRVEQLDEDLAGAPQVELASRHAVNFGNPIEDVRAWADGVLTQHPDLKAFWGAIDVDVVSMSQAVAARKGDAQYPDRPLVVGFFGNLENLNVIRDGQADAVVEVPLEAVGWIALDHAARYFEKETPFPADPLAGYETNLLEPFLITADNLPDDPGSYVAPAVDVPAFFTAKWEQDFTN